MAILFPDCNHTVTCRMQSIMCKDSVVHFSGDQALSSLLFSVYLYSSTTERKPECLKSVSRCECLGERA